MPPTVKHFFPWPDAELVAWGDRFNSYVQANFAALGLTGADAVGLNTAWFRFRVAYVGHVQAQTTTAQAHAEKVSRRKAFEALMRPAVRRIQTFGPTTDIQRAALGITIPDRVRTRASPPTTRPLVTVDFSGRLVHRVAFTDESTPTRRARPRGVVGAEVWVKITASGAAVPGPDELRFLSLCSRTPYTAGYTGADAGKTAHYMLRWVNTRGEKGPWGETASATVGA